MPDPHVLVVTSSGAPASAIVPVLAAIEAAGMRVRAIDVGGAGGGGGGMADRVRRALLGEGAERRLRKELEMTPPDAAVVFDPHAAVALTVARDQVPAVAGLTTPVIAVVGELEPVPAWAQTDADRFVAVDELAAVALADAGVEGERILVVGALGERAFAEAGAQERAALRSRFKLGGRVALIEVNGLGAEVTGSLALQLSLLDAADAVTYLFDAGSDVEAAAVLRRQVPTLGLRAKLFGATGDAALLWRAADVIVARPRPDAVARVMLVGGRLVALVDDQQPGSAKLAAALEGRKRGFSAKGLLMLSAALDAAFRGGTPPPPTDDGAENVADIVAAVAGDKRAVIDERRSAAQAATRERVRAASVAAQAAAQATAMPGELEDLSGAGAAPAPVDVPDRAELEKLRVEVARRVAEQTKAMAAAQRAANELGDKAKAARARGEADEAAQLERRADTERSRMHALLAELAQLESELKELEQAIAQIRNIPDVPMSEPEPDVPRRPRASIDDQLAAMKKNAGAPSPSSKSSASSAPPKSAPSSKSGGGRAQPRDVDDELAALKKKMSSQPPPKKKP
jgi:hypothetical protein